MPDAQSLLGLAALAVSAVALLVVAWRYPGVLFALYLIVPPVFKASIQPHLAVDLTVILALLCVPQILFVVLDPDLRRRPRPIGGYVVWCLLAALVSVAVWWSPLPAVATERAASWLALGFLPLLAAVRVTSDERHLVHFLRTLLVAGAVVIAFGLPGVFGSERLTILGADPIASTRAILLVPIIAVAFTSEHRWIRAAGFALYPPALNVVVATGSRGPLFAYILLSIVWLVSQVRRRELQRVVAPLAWTGLAVVSVVGLAAFLPAPSLDHFSGFANFATTGGGDVNSVTRVELFGYAIDTFVANPLVGLGTAGFQMVIVNTPFASVLYPHNIVLQFAAEFGLVGLSLLGASLVLFAARRDLRSPLWTSIRAVCVFYFLCGMVSSDALENRMVWGAMLLVLLAPSANGHAPPEPAADEAAG